MCYSSFSRNAHIPEANFLLLFLLHLISASWNPISFFEALPKGYFFHEAFPNVISFFLKHTNLFVYTSLRDSYSIFPNFYYSLCLLFPLPNYEYLQSWRCLLIFIVAESYYIDFKAVLIVWHVITSGTIKKEKILPIQLSPCFLITYFIVSYLKSLFRK